VMDDAGWCIDTAFYRCRVSIGSIGTRSFLSIFIIKVCPHMPNQTSNSAVNRAIRCAARHAANRSANSNNKMLSRSEYFSILIVEHSVLLIYYTKFGFKSSVFVVSMISEVISRHNNICSNH